MLRRILLGLSALAILVAAVLAGATEYLFADLERRYTREPRVAGVPAAAPDPPWETPYAGPHPRRMARPDETFEFPIPVGGSGPVEPLFAGPLQYPFLCMTEDAGHGQPLVDNQDGIGIPVYEEVDGVRTGRVVGYSKDCSMPTRVDYYYRRDGTDSFFPLAEADGDIDRIELDGRQVDFVVRVEVGTINRHQYGIAALRGPDDRPGAADTSLWNGRLLYQFKGGVGIGRRQGRVTPTRMLHRRQEALAAGYAVATSSANQTSNTYNIWLAEDTARRVKRQFVARYGRPEFTIGIGGSGGAIQQYLLGQNAPDVLDGGIALYSYPDMVTQTVYALDCELAEYYFDVTDADNPRWRNWEERRLVEGLNSVGYRGALSSRIVTQLMLALGDGVPVEDGLSECVKSWRGLAPLVQNPRYAHFQRRFKKSVRRQTHFTYWEDLVAWYGRDETGFARETFDNVGVQYGLVALREGRLTVEEFLDLNAAIGGWLPAAEMTGERYWGMPGARSDLLETSLWSEHNQTVSRRPAGGVAERSRGDRGAMAAAWWSGQVFSGRLEIPLIDLRHYLEDELDMHHSVASFQARLRIEREMGDNGNQVIWMTGRPHDPILDALGAMDRWLTARRQGAATPPEITDTCFDGDGRVIASGPRVWDGAWNGREDGACTVAYPPYGTSRIAAGGDYAGDRFACALKPVAAALGDGTYGERDLGPVRARLEEIFPEGVCDDARTDGIRPAGLFGPEPATSRHAGAAGGASGP
jgi:hypothetical protein